MDFFLSRTDSTVTPASLKYFAIYDPSLSQDDDDEGSSNSDQLLVYLSDDENEADIHTKIRRIGLITGMSDFCVAFDKGGESMKCVELEDRRIMLETFEGRYNFVISVSLTKIEEDDSKTVTYDKSVPSKFYSDLIVEGYNEFRLHNGTITSLNRTMERDEFVDYLERWWRVWFRNYQLELTEDGFLKQFEGCYHSSSLRLDSELKYSIDKIHEFTKFKEFLVWSNDSRNFGLVYEYSKSLDLESKARLLKWLEMTSYYGINTGNLLASNIPKIASTENQEETTPTIKSSRESENIYDPFKLVYETVSEVSKKTGISAGVNYGFKTMSDGLSTMNSYMPWRSSSKPDAPEQSAVSTSEQKPLSKSSEPSFLVGRINENSIVYKNLYLKCIDEEEESLHRLVIFEYETQLILMIYQFNANELNDLDYYDVLLSHLTKLGRIHLPKPQRETKRSKNFYYVGVDRESRTIHSTLPYVPRTDILASTDDAIDQNQFDDLSLNKPQCQLIHKELNYLFNSLWSVSPFEDDLKERLNITRNGWWIYNTNVGSKTIFILRKKRKVNHRGYSSSAALLDISANVNDILGKDAKDWLERYINGY